MIKHETQRRQGRRPRFPLLLLDDLVAAESLVTVRAGSERFFPSTAAELVEAVRGQRPGFQRGAAH